MERTSPEQQRANQQHAHNQQYPYATRYEFSAEELRVLRECNRESFYQRSLPFTAMLGVGTYYAVKSGYLKPSQSWGALPKVMVASIIGYFLGKYSYQQKCAEKLMQLPDSPVGELLRRRRQLFGVTPSLTDSLVSMDSGMQQALPSYSTGSEESFSDYSDNAPLSMDLDTTRPLGDSIDVRSPDDPFLEEEPLPPAQTTTTYEELRRQNREGYEKKRGRNPYESPNTIRTSSQPFSPPLTAPGDQNKYGDSWVS